MFEAVITYSSLNNLFSNINQAFKQAHRRAYTGYFSLYSFCLYAVIINLGSSSWKRSILVRISEKSSDDDEMRCVEMLRSLAGLHGLEFLKSRRGKASGWAVIRQAERNHIRYTIRTPPLLFLPNLPDHEKGNFHVAVSAVWSGKYCCLPCMLPFFQFKEKKSYTPLNAASFHPSISPPEFPFTSLYDSFFRWSHPEILISPFLIYFTSSHMKSSVAGNKQYDDIMKMVPPGVVVVGGGVLPISHRWLWHLKVNCVRSPRVEKCPHGLVVAAVCFSICMIFFFSVLSPVCCEVGVLAPSQRLDPSFIGRWFSRSY